VTLKIHTEEDDQRQLKVTVEVDEKRVQTQMRQTARSLAGSIHIPGFRRGKVPYNILVRRVGEEALRADAVEAMLESVFEDALDEVQVTPYRQPSLEHMEFTPLVLKLNIPLEPVVKLGDFRAIRKDIEPVEVTDEALADAIERIRSKHEILEEVERPAEKGDLVTVTGQGKIDDEESEIIWDVTSTNLIMDSEKVFPAVPLVENIVGLSAGEEKVFSFTFPDDYEEESLKGKETIFELSAEKVQSRELPELTDELVQEEGQYETVEEFRVGLREELQKQAEQQARSDLMDEVVDDMIEDAEIVYPPIVVELELDQTLNTFKDQITRSGWKWEDYLQLQGETEESVRDQWRDSATDRVKRGLIVTELITIEKLKVDTSEIDNALDKRLDNFSDNEELREQFRSIYSQGPGLEMMSNEILMDKLYERIQAIVTGNAPDLETLADDAQAEDTLEPTDEEE